jgi:hypothetical protein
MEKGRRKDRRGRSQANRGMNCERKKRERTNRK